MSSPTNVKPSRLLVDMQAVLFRLTCLLIGFHSINRLFVNFLVDRQLVNLLVEYLSLLLIGCHASFLGAWSTS